MATTHHSIITTCGGKTTLAFRRIVHKKATNDPVGTLDLMVYYVECGTQFTVDYGDIDEGFYASLEAMFTQVVKKLQHSDQDTIDRFLPRLRGLVRQARGIGWGYYDAIAETLEVAFPQ